MHLNLYKFNLIKYY